MKYKYKTSALDKAIATFAYNDLAGFAEKFESELKTLNNIMGEIDCHNDRYINALKTQDFKRFPYIECTAVDVAKNASRRLRRHVLNLNRLLSRPAPFLKTIDTLNGNTDNIDQFIDSLPVQVFFTDRAIMIQTPILWNRESGQIHGGVRKVFGADRPTIYSEEVRNAVLHADNYDSYNFNIFQQKLFQYYFVYGSSPKSRQMISDNDNIETKYITDAVAKLLPGGDEELTTSFYSSAFITDEIPSGTYVVITEPEAGIVGEQFVIDFWKDKPNKMMSLPD